MKPIPTMSVWRDAINIRLYTNHKGTMDSIYTWAVMRAPADIMVKFSGNTTDDGQYVIFRSSNVIEVFGHRIPVSYDRKPEDTFTIEDIIAHALSMGAVAHAEMGYKDKVVWTTDLISRFYADEQVPGHILRDKNGFAWHCKGTPFTLKPTDEEPI